MVQPLGSLRGKHWGFQTVLHWANGLEPLMGSNSDYYLVVRKANHLVQPKAQSWGIHWGCLTVLYLAIDLDYLLVDRMANHCVFR